MIDYYEVCKELNADYILGESKYEQGDYGSAQIHFIRAKSLAITKFEKQLTMAFEESFIDRFVKRCDKMISLCAEGEAQK